MKKPIITISILLLLTSNTFSKTYKCKDDEGNTIFSDSACNAIEREIVIDRSGPSDATLEKRAISSCLSHWKEQMPSLSQNNVYVTNYRFQWVTVRNIGARKMLYLDISTKDAPNPAMGFAPPQQLNCLMLGDGVSVNTYEHELEP